MQSSQPSEEKTMQLDQVFCHCWGELLSSPLKHPHHCEQGGKNFYQCYRDAWVLQPTPYPHGRLIKVGTALGAPSSLYHVRRIHVTWKDPHLSWSHQSSSVCLLLLVALGFTWFHFQRIFPIAWVSGLRRHMLQKHKQWLLNPAWRIQENDPHEHKAAKPRWLIILTSWLKAPTDSGPGPSGPLQNLDAISPSSWRYCQTLT